MALSTRLDTARPIRSGSPRTSVGSSSAVIVTRPAALRLARSVTALTTPSTRTSSSRASGLAPRASSTTSATRPVSWSSSSTMSARSIDALGLPAAGRASSSVWMLARRLAIGVRSSWLASATSWRCASAERSSASRVVLKLRARRASSSSPFTSIRRVRSGSAVRLSVRCVKRVTGASAVRATTAPSAAASATPPTATSNSTTRIRLSWRSTSSSGRATCTAPPGDPTVSTRRWVPDTSMSVK